MRAPISRPSLLWRAFVIGGIGTMKALWLSDDAWEWWEENVTDAIPRSTIRAVLFATLAVHATEAVVVNRAVHRAGLPHARSWTFTTLLYGFPAMNRARAAARAASAG